MKKTASKKTAFSIRAFIDPQYEYYLFTNRGGHAAYIKQWHVFSGLDGNETYRDPSFHELKEYLPYAQGILDLNEIYARKLADVPAEGFPESHTESEEKAISELKAKIEAMCAKSDAALKKETEDFIQGTNYGANKKKTHQLATAIAKRLEAIPQPTPFGASPPPMPTMSPTPERTKNKESNPSTDPQ